MNAVVEMLKASGLQVYMRKLDAEYCFATDGTGIAYVQWSRGENRVSTVHMPNKMTGTGFNMVEGEAITPENVRKAMYAVAPGWAKPNEIQSVRKYKSWDDFHGQDSWNAALFQV